MWRDDAYLLDMLIHARRARDFCAETSAERFPNDDVRQAAVLHVLQIVGEAAGKISPAFRDAHPEIPWHPIVGLRHILVHDYARVDLRNIWEIVTQSIPPLITTLELLVPPDSPSQDGTPPGRP